MLHALSRGLTVVKLCSVGKHKLLPLSVYKTFPALDIYLKDALRGWAVNSWSTTLVGAGSCQINVIWSEKLPGFVHCCKPPWPHVPPLWLPFCQSGPPPAWTPWKRKDRNALRGSSFLKAAQMCPVPLQGTHPCCITALSVSRKGLQKSEICPDAWEKKKMQLL